MSKPITARERSPFGDITPDDAKAAADQGKDRFYLPGYSDKRTARELALRDGKPAPALDHRFHLVPIHNLEGKPTGRGFVAERQQEGYKIVTKDMLKGLGVSIEGTPYSVAADGSIMNGDSLLMVTDADHARRNWARQQRLNDALMESPQQHLRDAAEKWNRNMGLTEKTGTAPIFELDEPK